MLAIAASAVTVKLSKFHSSGRNLSFLISTISFLLFLIRGKVAMRTIVEICYEILLLLLKMVAVLEHLKHSPGGRPDLLSFLFISVNSPIQVSDTPCFA